MCIKYKGKKVVINYIKYEFDYISFNYNAYIIIYINKNLDKHNKSRILHKTLKKVRN